MRKFKDVNELVNTLKPDYPVYCIRSKSIKTSTDFFKKNMPDALIFALILTIIVAQTSYIYVVTNWLFNIDN